FSHRHLQVELARGVLPQSKNIEFLNMTAVLTQMHRNSISAAFLGDQRRLNRIRHRGQTGLAHGRDMINVYSETDHIVLVARDRVCARLCSSSLRPDSSARATSTITVLSPRLPRGFPPRSRPPSAGSHTRFLPPT